MPQNEWQNGDGRDDKGKGRASIESSCFAEGGVVFHAQGTPAPRHTGAGGFRCRLVVRLRQVVTEGSPEHVVYAFGRDAVGAVAGNRQAGPALAQGVGVLHAQAHAAIVALVEVVPVAGGGFLDVFGLGAAASAGVEAGGTPVVAGSGIGEAGGVAEVVRAVADGRDGWRSPVTTPYPGRGILRCRGRAERSADAGVAAGVVPAVVQVGDEAGSGGNLYRAKGGEVVQGCECSRYCRSEDNFDSPHDQLIERHDRQQQREKGGNGSNEEQRN